MEILKKLVHQMRDEVEGAEHYQACAHNYKEEYPSWASEYLNMAQQEITHFDKLKNMADNYVAKHAEMKMPYEFVLEDMLERLSLVKMKIRG